MLMIRLISAWVVLMIAFASSLPAEKSETWVEVRSPNFRAIGNGGEKKAEQVAAQFEAIREIFRQALPFAAAHRTPLINVLAAKDEKSMSQLVPEYWATKGHMRPDGILFEGFNKYFVVLRSDTDADNAYETIYHEYFHSLTSPYFPGLPLWLSEGLAEFYGHTQIQGKDVRLGRADPDLLELLQQEKMLPILALFGADHSSPYYNEQNKATIFYAESWALTHYFMNDDNGAHRPQLADYLNRIGNGILQEQAAQQAFGDLNQLQKKLREYVGRSAYVSLALKNPPRFEQTNFPARQLSPAESAAVRGDFFVGRGRLEEAKPLLEQALRLDPKVALAHESMGFLAYQKGDHDEAARWFGEAIALDSQNYLTYFFRAVTSTQGRFLDPDATADAENDLRHAITLDPNFAPAQSMLGVFEASNRELWTEALALARKAVALEPGNTRLQVNLGNVYLRMNRIADAEQAGRIALLGAQSPEERSNADALLAAIHQIRQVLAGSRPAPQESSSSIEESKSKEDNDESSATKTAETPQTSAGGPATRLPADFESAEGNISDGRCSGFQMDLTLDLQGQPLLLHSGNFTRVQFRALNWKPSQPFNPCRDLKGLHVAIRFTPVTDQKYSGEIQTIDIRPQ